MNATADREVFRVTRYRVHGRRVEFHCGNENCQEYYDMRSRDFDLRYEGMIAFTCAWCREKSYLPLAVD